MEYCDYIMLQPFVYYWLCMAAPNLASGCRHERGFTAHFSTVAYVGELQFDLQDVQFLPPSAAFYSSTFLSNCGRCNRLVVCYGMLPVVNFCSNKHIFWQSGSMGLMGLPCGLICWDIIGFKYF